MVGYLNSTGVLEPFRSSNGQQLLILKSGELSVEQVLAQERFELTVNAYLMRALGTGLLFIALSKLTEILAKRRKLYIAKDSLMSAFIPSRIPWPQIQSISPEISSFSRCATVVHISDSVLANSYCLEFTQASERFLDAVVFGCVLLFMRENYVIKNFGAKRIIDPRRITVHLARG